MTIPNYLTKSFQQKNVNNCIKIIAQKFAYMKPNTYLCIVNV